MRGIVKYQVRPWRCWTGNRKFRTWTFSWSTKRPGACHSDSLGSSLLTCKMRRWGQNGQMVSWGLFQSEDVWFISDNNKRDATKHQLILCALVREEYGREKSKFVFLLLFFLFHYCDGPSSFTVRYLFYYLNFCISAMCIHLLKAALTCDAFRILLRFQLQIL